jgi:hypothetical protein
LQSSTTQRTKLREKKFDTLVKNNPKFHIENYMYERDIEKLKILFEKLEGELKVRFFNLRIKMLK